MYPSSQSISLLYLSIFERIHCLDIDKFLEKLAPLFEASSPTVGKNVPRLRTARAVVTIFPVSSKIECARLGSISLSSSESIPKKYCGKPCFKNNNSLWLDRMHFPLDNNQYRLGFVAFVPFVNMPSLSYHWLPS